MKLLSLLDSPARYPRRVMLITLLLLALAAVSIARIKPDTSLLSFFPDDAPAAVAMQSVFDHFESVDELLILATSSSPDTSTARAQLLALARRFEVAARADPTAGEEIAAVNYRPDAQMRAFFEKQVVPAGMFYLSEARYEQARQRLTLPEMRVQLERNRAMLATPGPAAGALSKTLLKDPLRLYEFLTAEFHESLSQSGDAEGFFSKDGHSLLIRVAGKKPPGDIAFSEAITRTATRLANQANGQGLTLEISGAYAIAAQSAASIRADAIGNVIGSVVTLAALMLLASRRPLSIFLLTFGTIAVGISVGFGVYGVMVGSITPLTAVIGGILAGMGIDYTIFYIVHYWEVRGTGLSPLESTRAMSRKVAGALVAAWATSVVGFIVIGLSTVRAMRGFAVLGSLGLTGAFVASILLLPALLMLTDRVKSPVRTRSPIRLNFGPPVRWITHHSRGLLVTACLLMLLAGVTLVVGPSPLRMDGDATVMHPKPNPPLDAQASIARRMGNAADSVFVHLHAEHPEELVALSHRAKDVLSGPDARDAGVASTIGLHSFLPDPTHVDRRAGKISPDEIDRVVEDFKAAVLETDFDPVAYTTYQDFLRTLLAARTAPGVTELSSYPSLASFVLPGKGDTRPTEALTIVFLSRALDQQSVREITVDRLRGMLAPVPGATLTGVSVLSTDIQAAVYRDIPRIVGASLTLIGIYLILHFRSVLLMCLALLPSVFSLALLGAIMSVTGMRLNLISAIAVPLLIGLTLDYGVLSAVMIRRVQSLEAAREAMAMNAQAVFLCAATSIIGFGSLAFTSVPAVRSLGIMVATGVGMCFVGTFLTTVPLIWLYLSRQNARRGEAVL